jgi:hypothetical protein
MPPEAVEKILALNEETFTRKVVWSPTPGAWLAEVWDGYGTSSQRRSHLAPRTPSCCSTSTSSRLSGS